MPGGIRVPRYSLAKNPHRSVIITIKIMVEFPIFKKLVLFNAVFHVLTIDKPISNSAVLFGSLLTGGVWQRCSELKRETEMSIKLLLFRERN